MFFREVAKKLLEFDVGIERNNYIEAAAEKYHLTYDQLVKMVSQTGEQLGDLKKRPEMGNVSKDPARRRQKEDAGVRSQRLLITWMSTSEQLYRNITRYVKPEDFTDGCAKRRATLLGTRWSRGI